MRHFTAAILGALMSAGAAQAAVYQYDMTMELESYNLSHVHDGGSGEIPQWGSEEDCQIFSDGYYDCEVYRLDVMNNRPTGRGLDQITPVATVSVRLDSDFGSSTAASPTCEGTPVLCWGFNQSLWSSRYSATEDGFQFVVPSPIGGFELSSDGSRYVDTNGYSGKIGEDDFYAREGFSVSYRTTDLIITEIAPIPLPASLPLLGIGLGAVGFAARRRKATRAV